MSYTVQITIPDDLYNSLRETARQTGQLIEVVAAEWLSAAAEQFVHDPLDAFIGAIDSSGSDWADNHDAYLGQSHAAAPTSDH